MSLFRTEFRRLFKRRLTRWMLLIGVLVLAAFAVGTFFTNQKIGPAQVAAAEQRAQSEYQQQVRYAEQARAECERAKADGAADAGRFPPDCSMITPPPPEAIQAQWFLPATFGFRQEFPRTWLVFAGILALVAFVVGASFVGAEWSSGGMMNLLLWRPGRLGVLAAKLGALLTGLLLTSLLLAVAWTAAFWGIATRRGSTAKVTPGVWQSLALTGARGVVLILLAGALGFAVASIGRHTALALGVVVGVVVVVQIGLGTAFALAHTHFPERWLLPNYVLAWIEKKVTLTDYRSCEAVMGQCQPKTLDITWHTSGVLFALAAVALVGAAFWAMRRRDIT